MSQRQRKAMRLKTAAPQNSCPKDGEKFQVEVQHRAKRFIEVPKEHETPSQCIGKITYWNQRTNYGFIQTESHDFDILVMGRDLCTREVSGPRKQNWNGHKVEFEMQFDNQVRAVNARLVVEKEREEEEEMWRGVPQEQTAGNDSKLPKSPSAGGGGGGGVKIRAARSRRSLAKHVEMDLMDWEEERYESTRKSRKTRRRVKEFDDISVVERRRREGAKLKLQLEREKAQKLKRATFRKKRKPKRSVAPLSASAVSRVPRAAPVVSRQKNVTKWVAPKKDDRFRILYNMFERIVTTSPSLQSRDAIRLIVQKLYQDSAQQKRPKISKSSQPVKECPVCFSEFSDSKNDETSDGDDVCVQPPSMSNCGHSVLCFDCLQHYTSLKIRDGQEILPWIVCPAEKCRAPIHFTDLMDKNICGLTTSELYRFCLVILQKLLARSPNFVECGGKVASGEEKEKESGCGYGFFCDTGELKSRRCKICGLVQQVAAKNPEDFLDDGFKAMLRSGKLRLCPVCSHPAMKDYGMCNVMECGKCGIFWNWNSKISGRTYAEVKQNGRNSGTLWEAGELDYQRNLESRDPAAFKDLLERNGIKYDPNFVRGRS